VVYYEGFWVLTPNVQRRSTQLLSTVEVVIICIDGLQLLECCTEKLGLHKAARRLFLDNGKEVQSDEDLDRDAEVYVSTGEPFKNPVKDMLRTCSLPVLCFVIILCLCFIGFYLVASQHHREIQPLCLCLSVSLCQCFDAVGWVAERASGL